MSRDFQFKQILRAYRMGIISEATLEQEMKVLENGAQGSSNGNGAFKAFGQTYGSERAAVMRFLEAVSAAETNGGDLVRAWLAICKNEAVPTIGTPSHDCSWIVPTLGKAEAPH